MMTKIFRFAFLPFLTVMAMVAGGAAYQTISIVPFWQRDISMFKNYEHWGIDYFPILSPLMTVLWLVLVITSFKVNMRNRKVFWTANFVFLGLMVSTFAYFAPFLLTHMGHPQNVSDDQLKIMLDTWAKWDIVRQSVGFIALPLFLYTYKTFDRTGTEVSVMKSSKKVVEEEPIIA
jgi:hypothetical protein